VPKHKGAEEMTKGKTQNVGAVVDHDLATGYVSFTSTIEEQCNHDTGWYATVRFFFLHRRIYVCSKCGNLEYEGGWKI
jgi:hypothetical protein